MHTVYLPGPSFLRLEGHVLPSVGLELKLQDDDVHLVMDCLKNPQGEMRKVLERTLATQHLLIWQEGKSEEANFLFPSLNLTSTQFPLRLVCRRFWHMDHKEHWLTIPRQLASKEVAEWEWIVKKEPMGLFAYISWCETHGWPERADSLRANTG